MPTYLWRSGDPLFCFNAHFIRILMGAPQHTHTKFMLVTHATQRVKTLYEVLHEPHAIESRFYHCNLQPAPLMELNF